MEKHTAEARVTLAHHIGVSPRRGCVVPATPRAAGGLINDVMVPLSPADRASLPERGRQPASILREQAKPSSTLHVFKKVFFRIVLRLFKGLLLQTRCVNRKVIVCFCVFMGRWNRRTGFSGCSNNFFSPKNLATGIDDAL